MEYKKIKSYGQKSWLQRKLTKKKGYIDLTKKEVMFL